MTTKELINTAKQITQENIETITELVKNLGADQLKWRPEKGVWNIEEVLAHLNEYGKYYHPTFEKKIENTRFTSTKEAFVSSPLGRSAWKSMKLGNADNIKRKFKAIKGYNPSIDPGMITGNEVHDYLKGEERMLVIIDKATNVNLRRVKIPISVAKVIRLRLGDALLFVIYHNQRHIQQIKNLLNNPKFPH